MPSYNIKITNLEEVKRTFNKAPEKMTKHLNDAIRKTLFQIQRGELEEYHALGIRIITRGLYSSIQRGVYATNLKGEVGPNANNGGVKYAGYVEGGTTKMKARPFLLNAVEKNKSGVDDLFKKAVQNTLDEIAREVR